MPFFKLNITKEELYNLYWNQKLNTQEIGEKFNVSSTTIINYLKRFDIKRRPASGKVGHLVSQRRLEKMRRKRGPNKKPPKFYISKEELEDLYINQKLNTREIAKLYSTNKSSVGKLIKKYNIQMRPSAFQKGYYASKSHRKLNGEVNRRNPETGHGYRWGRIEIPCDNCGKIVVKIRKHFKKQKKHFCNEECHFQYKEKVAEYFYFNYGRSWRKAQKKARQRDKVCQFCKKYPEDRQLHVHHIIPFKKFGVSRHKEANNLSNLICYCPSCHKFIEECHTKKIIEPIFHNFVKENTLPTEPSLTYSAALINKY